MSHTVVGWPHKPYEDFITSKKTSHAQPEH
jgi:hypothetical protein